MYTLDKYLLSSLNTMDKWFPWLQPHNQCRRRRQQRYTRTAAQTVIPPKGDTASDTASTPEDEARFSLSGNSTFAPTLAQMIASLPKPPHYATLLGACEDGLPFLIDLTNPAPGSFLAIGDSASGKTNLLRSLLHSACWLNSPEKFNCNIIAGHPDKYRDLDKMDHCHAILPVDEQAVESLITELVATAETRKHNHDQDQAVILAIDDLAALIPFLDDKGYASLYWLIRHGPLYRVWTIAGLSSEQAEQVDARFLSAFRTRLFGYMHNERLAQRLGGDNNLATRQLEKGKQFFVPYGGEWLRFWICMTAETTQEI
jgi:hypothetical protein